MTVLIIFPCQGALAQGSWPDPVHILQKADSSLERLSSISYSAEHFAMGMYTSGGESLMSPASTGRVDIERVAADTVFGAKLRISGKKIRALPKYTDRAIEVSYDGDRIRALDPKRKIAYVNEPDRAGRSLILLQAGDLLVSELYSEDGLLHVLEADSIRFDGTAIVEDVPCYVIYAKKVEESLNREYWYFLSFEDYLPRKVVIKYSGIPGQERTEVTTLNVMLTNQTIPSGVFVLHVPASYEVKMSNVLNPVANPGLPIGSAAPDWTLSNSNGTPVELNDLEGSVVLVDFWATWCGPCIDSMHRLQDLHDKYADRGLVVLGVNIWEGGDPVQFMKEKGFTYEMVTEGDEVASDYKVNGLPTLYAIGPNGKIIYQQVGSDTSDNQALIDVIERHLPE